jgi:hypothetical protein
LQFQQHKVAAAGAFEPIGGGESGDSTTYNRHVDIVPLDGNAVRKPLVDVAIPQPMPHAFIRANDFTDNPAYRFAGGFAAVFASVFAVNTTTVLRRSWQTARDSG